MVVQAVLSVHLLLTLATSTKERMIPAGSNPVGETFDCSLALTGTKGTIRALCREYLDASGTKFFIIEDPTHHMLYRGDNPTTKANAAGPTKK